MKTHEEENNCQLLIHDFPAQLKRDFKTICAQQDVTMRETIILLVQQYLQTRKK